MVPKGRELSASNKLECVIRTLLVVVPDISEGSMFCSNISTLGDVPVETRSFIADIGGGKDIININTVINIINIIKY